MEERTGFGTTMRRFRVSVIMKLLEQIQVPAHNVTSCSFGGPDLETLYITTSSLDMNEEEERKFPNAGSLFEVKPGVRGVKGNYFAE